MDLGSFILGELFRAMFLLSTDPKQSHGGPMWLMQMWAYLYFPSIAPEMHPTIVPQSYGEAWMHANYPKEIPTYPNCFKLFSDPSREQSPEDFMPFEAKQYGSEDFKSFSNLGFFRGLVVIRSTNAGVKAYCPSLVARQFGLVQLLPVPPTWTKNKDWSARVSISKDEAKKVSVLSKERIKAFPFNPFQVRLVSSPQFQSWWEAYLANFNNNDDLNEAIQG